jgi:hypothetical protein
VRRSFSSTRKLAVGAVATIVVAITAVLAWVGLAGSASMHVSRSVDTGLCPFPLDIAVRSKDEIDQGGTSVLKFRFIAPTTITLRNAATGRTATLHSIGAYEVAAASGTVTFGGHRVWYWAAGKHVPFASTDGSGSLQGPRFLIRGAPARAIDPCALVGGAPASTRPATTPAPWGLPRNALSRIGYAGLSPLIGNLVRHDHVHVDVIVNGRHVTIPAGVGLAEPMDTGPCPNGPAPTGDCRTGHIVVAQVANSPLHTHSTSGLIHIEPDRRGTYTLGQFFDEWGVRLTSTCVSGYCAGGGKELRAFVDGKRVRDPRAIVLTNRQEIAVVFGGPGAFASVPSTYKGGWPGLGCGGPGEFSC